MTRFRIHGDNIVECERIAQIILKTLKPEEVGSYLITPSTIAIEFRTTYAKTLVEWRLELLPGFNKNTKRRWDGNIFEALKEAGSYFDETPDIVVAEVDDEENEKILLSIEFCSALQAGNQAWQRSARAFSVGRTGCPYLYVIDIGKYELDKETRKRKNVRLPNTAVAYSYINYSENEGHFVAQLYTRSEEFNKEKEPLLKDFDEADFGGDVLGTYIVKLLLGMNTAKEEADILHKNMDVVQFLARKSDEDINYTEREWQEIYSLAGEDIVDYAVKKNRFGFHKTIAQKSHHGKSEEVVKLVDELSVGLASKDLPFGIIPADDRPAFAKRLYKIYPCANTSVIDRIGCKDKHLIIALFKGFKPHGDDNRPDRGLLPLAAMLSSSDVDVMSYIYGPVIEANLKLLDTNPGKLANKNGLWRSVLSLSSFVVLDVPVLSKRGNYDVEGIYDTSNIKEYYSRLGMGVEIEAKKEFSSVPVNYGEDDVDTGIHYFFTHILGEHCFEGMCNPPGGDWSGFSILDGEYENRWLSLPRVSDAVNGKRPDHILELFGVFEKPVLLSIESKEKSVDLEDDVGTKLITYIRKLMSFIPSAKREVSSPVSDWRWGDSKVEFANFESISAAAYLKRYAEEPKAVFEKNCEILFVMAPMMTDEKIGWEIEIIPSTERSTVLKEFIIEKYNASGDHQFTLK